MSHILSSTPLPAYKHMHSKSPSSLSTLRTALSTNTWAFTQRTDTSSLQDWQLIITNTAVLLWWLVWRYFTDNLSLLCANWSEILILQQMHFLVERTNQNQPEEISTLFVLGKFYRHAVGSEKKKAFKNFSNLLTLLNLASVMRCLTGWQNHLWDAVIHCFTYNFDLTLILFQIILQKKNKSIIYLIPSQYFKEVPCASLRLIFKMSCPQTHLFLKFLHFSAVSSSIHISACFELSPYRYRALSQNK